MSGLAEMPTWAAQATRRVGCALALSLAPATAWAAETVGEEHAEAGGTLPQLVMETWAGQIFWLLVTFAALYFVLSRSILPAIGAVIEDRRDKIADDLDEASRLKKQADESAASLDRTLADARAKAGAIAGRARAELDAQIATETAAVDAQAAALSAQADEAIREAAAQAMANAQDVATDAAMAIVKKLTGASPTKTTARAAVKAALSGKS